jgi:enoyl-CoA hydratase/carnithine racemase
VTASPALPAPDVAGWVSPRQLAEGVAQAPLLDADGQLTWPLVVVDLDAPPDPPVLAAACSAAQAAERVIVGVSTRATSGEQWYDLLGALHVTLTPAGPHATPRQCAAVPDPAATVRALQAAATASPQAAVTLAQVLRASERLDVRAALNVESFAYSTLLGGAEFGRWLASRPARPVPQPGPGPAVIIERHAAALQITLNRPARRNAYSRELRDALTEALLVPVLDETIRRVVITGAGPSFCSGGDLDEFGTAPDLATAHFIRTRAGAAGLLHRIADRAEVRAHGTCIGAGIELAAFAGRVIARPGTTFRLPEVAMGLIPGAGGTVSIPRRIGRWRTLYLALSGSPLDAGTAVAWGLVDEMADLPAVGP